MIPMLLEASSRRRDSSTARVQPKPLPMPLPPLQSDDDDTTINNDNDIMAQPSINIGGAEYGNDDGFITTPAIHDHDHIICIDTEHYFQSFQLLSYPTPTMAGHHRLPLNIL